MQQLHLQSSGRVINMRQYNVQIIDEVVAEMEQQLYCLCITFTI